MPGVQTSNLGGSMNPSGGVATSLGSSMPNIAQQQTWNNPSWTQQAGAWLGSDSMSQGMGLGSMSNMNMILQADQMGGQLMGLLAGQNESTVGNIVKSIPGLSTVGNLINAAFGSHINEEFVRQTVLGTNAQKTKTFNSNTNSDVLNDWRGFNFLSNVSKDEVGSDGWFSNKAKNKTNELNNNINAANDLAILNFGHAVDNADANSDLRIAQSMVAAYGGPINSFRKYYDFGGSLYDTPQFFSAEPQVYDDGGYLSKAKALIRQNEGWREKPYKDAPKGKNWRSVGYGFNDSGFREKYPEGISKHYEHGITKKQAEEELDYFLNKAEKQLKSIYGKQWNDFTDSQKAAILDTYYQRPASVAKGSRFYKAITSGEDAGRYLGVAGYDKRNKIRQGVFGGDYSGYSDTEPNPSTLQEVTPIPVIQDLDLEGITPTQAKALELNLTSPTFDLSMFGKPMTTPSQQAVPTVGTVEDFLASYGDFEDNLFKDGGNLFAGGGNVSNNLNEELAPLASTTYQPLVNQVKQQAANYNVNDYTYRVQKLHPEITREQVANLYNNTPYIGSDRTPNGTIGGFIQATEDNAGNRVMLYPSNTSRKVTKKNVSDVMDSTAAHETNHLMTNILLGGHNDAEKDMLWEAYPAGFMFDERGGDYFNEVRATNAQLREAISKKYGNAIGADLDKAIDNITDEDLINLYGNINGYVTSDYKKHIKKRVGAIRKALKNVAYNQHKKNNDINIAALGGKLNIKDINIFDNGGWMDFFNAWGQAQGGNNYFGNNNWKPSDGLQTNTSNGSVQDWMGVASSVVNTVSNWGKEDPSLGRGGGYSQFGMAAYDLMKTIRDATKHRKEPMDRKLGIPIYAQGGHLFSGGGDIGAMGYAQIGTSALKLISNAKHQASLDDDIDLGKIKRSINRQGFNFSDAVANVNTNGDLLDLWKDYSEIPANLTMRDFRDKSLFDDFLNGYAASWEGFNAGQNFGPWGAAIGAVVGGLSSNIASLIGRSKAQDAADDANRRIERANKRMVADLNYGAERVDAENDLRMLQNMDRVSNAADGGRLDVDFGLRNPFTMPNGVANPLYKAFGGGLTHGSDWDTGINWVNEGGSHGENPLGGVQMGVDEQGVPNLVEEGEAIWNGDYVFSKRMKVPKKLAKKYGLGGDMTFADAIAKLTKDSEERPLSNIDRATNDHILGEFADSQEELRMAKAQRAMDKEIQLQDDFLTGFQFGLGGHMSPLGIVPDADNISPFEKAEKLFADGGGIHIDPSKKGTFKAQASKMGMGVQEAASHILAHKENYSPEMVKKAVFAHNFAHAFGGSLFDNPFGETNTFDFGGDLKTRRDTIMRNSGVTEEQANAMLFRMLSKEDRGRVIKERVFGTWTPTYNSNMEIVVPTSATSNREVGNGNQAAVSNPQSAKKGAGKTSANSGSVVPFAYDWYRNGSDGIGTPTGFKVGKNGKAYDYTPEYKALVASLGADDIRKWAAEHPNDPSLKSFLAKGNKLENLTDEQWRKGATDGKYGFMHHVADSMLGGIDEFEEVTEPAITRVAEDPEWAVDFGDPEVMRNIEAGLNPDGTPISNVRTTRNGFRPKQTWTRNLPWMMSGIMGLKEMLTPADYGNADSIMEAAYQVGSPVSIGTEYLGDYRKRDPFDERYLMNLINQRGAATNRNMMNLSGGNRAAAMAGILSNDLTTQMSLAEAARQSYLANRADDAQVAEFNRGTNQFNAQAQNQRNQFLAQLNSQRQNAMLSGIAQGARLRQAIKDQRDAAISANLSAFAQGLGDIGWENYGTNQVNTLFENGYTPYWLSGKGNVNFKDNV